jgi:HEAT repeat protein
MVATGETYTAARAALAPASPRLDVPALVSHLADPARAASAAAMLAAQPPQQLVPALVTGLDSPHWRVRRNCCRLLDDLDFTPQSRTALLRALDDRDPRVRRAAVHTLSCRGCKPGGCAVDIQPLFERMAADPSHMVRDAVLNPLGWWPERHQPWARRLLEHLAASDPSAKLREHARGLLADQAIERAADAERRRLPARLRVKTERHPLGWVALDGDRLVAGSQPAATGRDLRRWREAGDVTALSPMKLRWYYVLPDTG